MAEVKKFFIDNSSQIWTLVSVVIGGLVTYLSTSAAERRKDKRRVSRENLEQILVPCCTCLENTITDIHIIYQDATELYIDSGFTNWMDSFKKPLEYLKPAKRIFLSHAMREKLQRYKRLVGEFKKELEQEFTDCTARYKHYISAILEHFPNIQSPMAITFTIDKIFEVKTKVAILSKNSISILENITCIDFIMDDNPENYRSVAIYLNEDTRTTWGAIEYGAMDISEVGDHEVELACLLLDFINKNVTDETEVLDKIIDGTCSAEYLSGILDSLNDMVKGLLKEIDKITN